MVIGLARPTDYGSTPEWRRCSTLCVQGLMMPTKCHASSRMNGWVMLRDQVGYLSAYRGGGPKTSVSHAGRSEGLVQDFVREQDGECALDLIIARGISSCSPLLSFLLTHPCTVLNCKAQLLLPIPYM